MSTPPAPPLPQWLVKLVWYPGMYCGPLGAGDANLTLRVVGTGMTLIGLYLVPHAVMHIGSQPWDLAARGIVVHGRRAENDPLLGDSYAITVEGQTYTCHRGSRKLGNPDGASVLYDPRDPSRCRARDTASLLGLNEFLTLAMGMFLFCTGVAQWIASFAEPRQRFERENPPLRPRVWRAAILVSVVGTVWGIAVLVGAAWLAMRPEGVG